MLFELITTAFNNIFKLKLFRNESPGNQNTLGPTQRSHNLVGWRTSLETPSELIAILPKIFHKH